jgi:hypothetical protein
METRQKISATMKKRWEDPEFRSILLNKMRSVELRQQSSMRMKEKWSNPAFREKLYDITSKSKSDEWKKKMSDIMRKKWAEDESYRIKTISGRGKISD